MPELTVASADGTRIAVWRSGEGPPLLLVHGATSDHRTTWRLIQPELERRFTVYAMDRRGRGGSGDAPDYELRRETEDLVAVVERIGEPVNLLGHSYGGLCAIEAARLTSDLRRLVLYEGVPLRGSDIYPPGVIRRLESMLEAGDVEGMLVAVMREVADMTPEEVDLVRSQADAWAVRLANAPTVPREMRVEEGYRFDSERFERMATPTLLLVGGESPRYQWESARAVADALPNAWVRALPMHRARERWRSAGASS